MAIIKLPAHEVILIFLQKDATSALQQSDEVRFGFMAGLLGVLGRMIIPEGQKMDVISKLRVLARDNPELAESVETTILRIEAE
jgi:hypothetical protein